MSTLLAAALLSATPVATDMPPAFAAPVVADAELAVQRGGFVRPGVAGRRVIADANAMSTLQFQASGLRLGFDNWFANEGATLIVNNQLIALGR